MGGFASTLGHVAGGFEQAAKEERTRAFADEENRRSQISGFLQKIALDENAHPYSRQQATQQILALHQTPYNKPFKFDPNTLIAPREQTTTPGAPGMQVGNISLPPTPPQAVTLDQGMFKSPEQQTREASERAASVGGAQAGATLNAQIGARQHAMEGLNPPLPPEESVAFALGLPPAMIGGYGSPSVIPAKQALASGMTLPQGVDPETGWVRIEYNRMGHPVGTPQPAVAPAAYAPTTSEGFTYQPDAAGNMIAIPVTTTRQKTTPGVSMPPPPPASARPEEGKKVGSMKPPQALVINPPTTPGGSATAQAIRPGSKVNPQAVTAAGMSSANVPTATIRTMAGRAQGQLTGIQQLGAEIDRLDKEGKLGPMSGRWNDFMQGKVGAGDPEFAYLNDKIDLVQTAMMLIHAGGRSSTPILTKFQSMLDAGKMDGPTLKAGLRAIREQMEQYAHEGKIPGFGPPAPPTGGPSGGPKVGTVEDGYRFKGGNAADPSSWEKVK